MAEPLNTVPKRVHDLARLVQFGTTEHERAAAAKALAAEVLRIPVAEEPPFAPQPQPWPSQDMVDDMRRAAEFGSAVGLGVVAVVDIFNAARMAREARAFRVKKKKRLPPPRQREHDEGASEAQHEGQARFFCWA